MSLVEAFVFLASRKLRREAQNTDEATLADRKNPPIKSVPTILRSLVSHQRKKKKSSSGREN
jgi:hypothetical protein